jgi:hypothetical protein
MLGDPFRRLEHDGDGYRVTVHGQPDAVGTTAEEAYGYAVLLRQERRRTPTQG